MAETPEENQAEEKGKRPDYFGDLFERRGARWALAFAALLVMGAGVLLADPGRSRTITIQGKPATVPVPFVDRVLIGSFTFFTAGLALLFALFVVLTIIGRINLPRAFEDKPADDSDTRRFPKGSVSLSRLQSFLWTLVVMTVYFHRVVTNKTGELPTIPPELLMVMGISGAVYLVSKEISKPKIPSPPAPLPEPQPAPVSTESPKHRPAAPPAPPPEPQPTTVGKEGQKSKPVVPPTPPPKFTPGAGTGKEGG